MAEKNQNIFLFYGNDTYSSKQKLNFWKKEFIEKYEGDTNLETIEGKKLNPTEFNTNLEAVPFLSKKRLIIIKDFLAKGSTDDQKKVAENLNRTPDFCVIIFHENEIPDKRTSLFQKLSKLGKAMEFPIMTPPEITRWILDHAKKRNITIKSSTATYLSQYAGPDLWTISSELEKLTNFADKKEITTEMIDELSIPSIHASIFRLTDAISEKKSKESLKILNALKESGEELTRTFFMIVRHFRILIQVHEMLEKGENRFTITKKLKQHPFVIEQSSKQAKNFTSENLIKIYQRLLKIDTGFKTGIIKTFQSDDKEYQLAIEQFIIDCCSVK